MARSLPPFTRSESGTIRGCFTAMSTFLSAFSVSPAVQNLVPACAPAAVPAYEPIPAHLRAGEPTRAAAFALGDRVYFFGGRHSAGSQLYTLTARRWMVNPLVPGGAGWYYRARATGPKTAAGRQLVGEECRWIGEEFTAGATL